MKRWHLKQSKIDIHAIAADLGIQRATAAVLANRNLVSKQDARRFMLPDAKNLIDATQLKDMEKAVSLLMAAIQNGTSIAVYGDYDVDGVTSCSILTRSITRCGGNVCYYVPHRQHEGYGLNMQAVKKLAEDGIGLLLTCDNGISAINEIALAKQNHMTVVVLDHHEPGFIENAKKERVDLLPPADAIVDHKQQACHYPFPYLCAAGISYKFALLLLHQFGHYDERLEKELLCLATLATVCDIVDLLGENRTLVQLGLREIPHTTNIGLQALLKAIQKNDMPITETDIGFQIGPCINATGRLESGQIAVELFCTDNPQRAAKIAEHLVTLNNERKELTDQASAQIIAQLEQQNQPLDSVLVLFQEDVHESIAGIVAGRMKDKYYHPTIMLTGASEGIKGSARSIPGYHIFEALCSCKELFTRFGGHAMAAGLSMPKENIALLRKRLNENCPLTQEDMIPILRIEQILSFSEIHQGLAEELQLLAPFGKENPKPMFATIQIWVTRLRLVGKNKNIMQMQLLEEKTGTYLHAISFQGYSDMEKLLKELYPNQDCDTILSSGKLPMPLDIVYTIGLNSYQGNTSVQLEIKDFRVSKTHGTN